MIISFKEYLNLLNSNIKIIAPDLTEISSILKTRNLHYTIINKEETFQKFIDCISEKIKKEEENVYIKEQVENEYHEKLKLLPDQERTDLLKNIEEEYKVTIDYSNEQSIISGDQ